jgi:general secretion pathway protein L
MSVLVVLLPERARLSAADAADETLVRPGQEYAYLLVDDDLQTVRKEGSSATALLPKARSVVCVVGDADVAWHRITVPKAPASRLRDALLGVLEESLLDDGSAVHLATLPGATAGQPGWVGVIHKPWLQAHLASVERTGMVVDRVVAVCWPDHPPIGHFEEAVQTGEGSSRSAVGDALVLTWASADGVLRLPLRGGAARSVLPTEALAVARWTASPAASTLAQQWTGLPLTVLSPAQRALQATRSTLNLRQFDLAPRQRGTLWLRDTWRRWLSPAWRPVRWGVAALVAVQVAGLNLWAWQQERAVLAKRQALVATLQASFPQVRAVLDAPLQMQREVDALRQAAGRSGEVDLEPMLQAAAAAWPADRPPVDTLRYEPGRLSLSAAGWNPTQVEQFRAQLRPSGWQVDSADGRLTLSRAAGPAGGSSL